MITAPRCLVAALLTVWISFGGAQQTAPGNSSTSPGGSASRTPPVPDVGGLEAVPVQATGRGKIASQAVDDAIRAAILQVNGTTVDLSSEQFSAAIGVAIGKSDLELKSSGFAQWVSQHSRGAVLNFKVVSLARSEAEQQYIAVIEANIAKYRPPADSQRPKVVVAPLHLKSAAYQVGNESIAASQLAAEMHQELIDALSQTERFSVLDREFSAETSNELDLVSSGQAPSIEFAKLGQALSADLILVATVDSFGYVRHSSQLATSDRALVSYSGGATLSYRLINVATRQIVVSDSVDARVAPLGPTTLPLAVNGQEKLSELESGLVSQVVPALLMRMFPVTVVSRTGDAVSLSQGGRVVREHTRYQVVLMGDELKDPQTGQSLGRVEHPCCVVEVERVTPTLAYGTLYDVKVKLDQLAPGGLQLRQISAAATGSSRSPEVSGGNAVPSRPNSSPPQPPAAIAAPTPFSDESDAQRKKDNW